MVQNSFYVNVLASSFKNCYLVRPCGIQMKILRPQGWGCAEGVRKGLKVPFLYFAYISNIGTKSIMIKYFILKFLHKISYKFFINTDQYFRSYHINQ